MAFVSLGLLELIHSFNIRSDKSIFKIGINKYLILSILLGIILQVGVVLIPNLAQIFKVVPLNKTQWLYTSIISILPIVIMEIQKKINEIKFGTTIYQINMKTCQKTKDNV